MSETKKISSLSSRAVSAGSKVAPIFGAWMGWTQPLEGADMGAKFADLVSKLKGFKIADPMITTELAFSQPDKYPIASGVGLYFTGYIINEIGKSIGSGIVSGLGRIAKRGGGSLATNSLAASYFYLAKDNPHPTGTAGYGGGDKTTIQRDNPQIQFASSTTQPYTYGGGTL